MINFYLCHILWNSKFISICALLTHYKTCDPFTLRRLFRSYIQCMTSSFFLRFSSQLSSCNYNRSIFNSRKTTSKSSSSGSITKKIPVAFPFVDLSLHVSHLKIKPTMRSIAQKRGTRRCIQTKGHAYWKVWPQVLYGFCTEATICCWLQILQFAFIFIAHKRE